MYLRARSYDPGLGRFVSQDPLPFLQRYAYAGSDPANLSDPSGLCWVCDVGTAIGHGAENVGHRIVDNVADPKSLAGDIQLVSGAIVVGCLYASPSADGGGLGLPACGFAATAYGLSSAYLAYKAENTHELVVVVTGTGIGLLPLGKIGEFATDTLAPLALPRTAEAPEKPAQLEANLARWARLGY